MIGSIRDVRRMGAAAVDLCSVACGRVDGYYERGLKRWDLAAGSLIAATAGARVSELDDGTVIAAAPGVYDAAASAALLAARRRRPAQARLAPIVSTASWAVSVGLLPTRTPLASSASFFASAVPEEPEMIAPAWPICLPGGAVKPAM